MVTKMYERDVEAILKEVEAILKGNVMSKSITVQIKVGAEDVPAISYKVEEKVVIL